MKAILFSVLGVLMTTQAMATDQPTAQSSDAVIDYHYGMHLDIARVVSHSEIPNVCHAVPVEMTYEDSNGQQHRIRYQVMGNGCLGG
ncbi:DUF2790 domain-containing protein [Pseudomonas sp. AOB-7]|jgi:hypothetical protein|uniref:DUF2790 domain-containing protein n=1 Tax=unclassified Pseudomonas TaxID=196821 RepID=UPI0003964BD1|nr:MULTISPECIES: DUF2790 domain-containing protein [unclassified Pseudomonas]ERI49758.1 hypothetical protein N878_02330 [Pseudomonas sp. EGD-AK9]RMH85988.1 DUF2790 domain-containing protein [Pseudomonas sp. AOB-7]